MAGTMPATIQVPMSMPTTSRIRQACNAMATPLTMPCSSAGQVCPR